MKKAGILLPIFSLPSEFGVGTLGAGAYGFVDFLEKAEQDYWQILPLQPADESGSPYRSDSAFASDPVFIDPEKLRSDGLLKDGERDALKTDSLRVRRAEREREKCFRLAYSRFDGKSDGKFAEFCERESYWLDDYALFKTLKEKFDGKPWTEWEEKYAKRDGAALDGLKEKNADELGFYKFLQYEFSLQYESLKTYANGKGIKIIGDMPIYVAHDSADVWANPEAFMLDENGREKLLAGCPPDAFSEDGQLWGNPVYDWAALKKTGYAWWLKRFRRAAALYDCLRLDHFRGFESFYAVKSGSVNARKGEWLKGPGTELFDKVSGLFPGLEMIAEDLGFITDKAREFVKKTGYPNMKVLQFGFGGGGDNEHLPRNYGENCVAYTGTHDNDTLKGWYDALSLREKIKVRRLIKARMFESIGAAAVRALYKSKASTVILPLADVLGCNAEYRINAPGTVDGKNWSVRFASLPSDKDAERLRLLVRRFKRSSRK